MSAHAKETVAPALAFLAGAALGQMWRQKTAPLALKGKLALVTGGSRGLGRALVRELAGRGAKVLFCARHADELARTEAELKGEGLDATGLVADLTRPDQPFELAERVRRDHGSVDILINNAGVIQVAPFALTTEQSFHQCLDLFVYAPIRLSKAVLPHMIKRKEGTIVNVASVGGQVIAPHMAPYNCGKAALVALSESMSVELDRFGVHVLTVMPGLMRTGSHRNAKFAGRRKKEYSWFSHLAVNPLVASDPYRTAGKVVKALVQRKRTLYVGWEAQLGPLFHNAFPELSLALTSAVEKLLPPGGEQEPRSGEFLARSDSANLGPLLQRVESAALAEHQAARYSPTS